MNEEHSKKQEIKEHYQKEKEIEEPYSSDLIDIIKYCIELSTYISNEYGIHLLSLVRKHPSTFLHLVKQVSDIVDKKHPGERIEDTRNEFMKICTEAFSSIDSKEGASSRINFLIGALIDELEKLAILSKKMMLVNDFEEIDQASSKRSLDNTKLIQALSEVLPKSFSSKSGREFSYDNYNHFIDIAKDNTEIIAHFIIEVAPLMHNQYELQEDKISKIVNKTVAVLDSNKNISIQERALRFFISNLKGDQSFNTIVAIAETLGNNQ